VRQALGGRLLREQGRRHETVAQIRSSGRQPRRTNRSQPHLLFRRGRMVVRPVPRAGTSHRTHAGRAQRRLLGVVVAGAHHLRPDDGAARQRTRRPHAVRRKRRSCRSHQSGRGGGAEVLPAAKPGRRRAGAQQLLLDQPAQRRFLFDRDARRSPHLGEAAGVRPLHAQRSARVAQRLLRRGERRRPDRQFPVPQERRRHLRPRLHDEPERASRRARRLAALPGTERPAARRDFRSGVGQDLATFLLGLPTSGTLDRNTTRLDITMYHGLFVQDDWKVSNRLTLNLGLRYDYESATYDTQNRNARGFDPTATLDITAPAQARYAANPIPQLPASAFAVRGGLQFASDSARGFWNADKNNFQPRAGFAYRLGEKSVVRGGWGIYTIPFII